MNNFKKLLASAMALSMVASVVPTNVKAEFSSVRVSNTESASNYVEDLMDALKAIDKDITTVTFGDKVKFHGTVEENVVEFDSEFKLNETLVSKLGSVMEFTRTSSDEYAAAKHLLGLGEALNNMVLVSNDEALFWRAFNLIATGSDLDYEVSEDMLTVSKYATAVEIMEEMEKVEAYEGNLPERVADQNFGAEEYLSIKADLQEKLMNLLQKITVIF